jgi:hypothetical protein
MQLIERIAKRMLQFLAANDAIGHRAVAVVAGYAHHALFGVEDGREVLDVFGGAGVEEQSGNYFDRNCDASFHVGSLLSVLLFVMYVVFIYVNKKRPAKLPTFSKSLSVGVLGTRTRWVEFSRRHGTALPHAHGMCGANRVADGGVLHKMELC